VPTELKSAHETFDVCAAVSILEEDPAIGARTPLRIPAGPRVEQGVPLLPYATQLLELRARALRVPRCVAVEAHVEAAVRTRDSVEGTSMSPYLPGRVEPANEHPLCRH
jgi:hypothetical protein